MVKYTIGEIKAIEKTVAKLLNYANKHKTQPLDRCYQFCETILKNISICREAKWEDIDVLSQYIYEDWAEANKLHLGQYSHSFFFDWIDSSIERSTNIKIDKLISKVDQCIYRTLSQEQEIIITPNKYEEKVVNKPPMTISDDILNAIYKKSLEWGENWRRPIDAIIKEVAVNISSEEQISISEYVDEVRSDIEDYIYHEYSTSDDTYGNIYEWIVRKYPWINEENIKHAISQGIYYAIK